MRVSVMASETLSFLRATNDRATAILDETERVDIARRFPLSI